MWQDMIRFKPFLIAVWHLVVSLLLAYAFIIVLMTASSQAGVAERLGNLTPPVAYSAGYPLWLERQETDRSIRDLRRRIGQLNVAIEKAGQERQSAEDRSLTAVAPLLALHPRLSAIPECNFNTQTNPGEIAKSISRIRFCLTDADLPPSLKENARKLTATDSITESAEKWLDLWHVEDGLKRRRTEMLAALKLLEGRRTELGAINDSFGEISVLQRSWMVGGGALTEFPPAMTQILLAFVSGLFGSLLLTLVLIVYPKTDMKLGETGKGYGPRILLGGLISLCVFVVIGGGTAVLGTNNAFAGGEANYLAFCAIGILAGMFSDRVASWLSERADTFFKLSAQDAAAKAAAEAERAAAEAESAAVEAEAAARARERPQPADPAAAREAGGGI